VAEGWESYAGVEGSVPDVFVALNCDFALFVIREEEDDVKRVWVRGHLVMALR
jgi:hypothetical protein